MTDASRKMPRGSSRRGLAVAALLLGLGLSGCGSLSPRGGDLPAPPPSPPQTDGPPHNPPDVMNVPDAVPRVEPRSRYGNPKSYVVMGKEYRVLPHGLDYVQRGGASWYGTKFHGQRTSSGEPYDLYGMTAAHCTLPIPSYARITNLANGRSVIVRVNDRGPFHSGRIIDLSYTAAKKLDIFGHGTGQVEVRAIDPLAAMNATADTIKSEANNHAPPRAMTPAPASGGNGKSLYLQVGAFSKHSNASNLVERLQRSDFTDLRIAPSVSRKATVYRVLIGPLANAEVAGRMSARLSGVGIELPQIVKD